MEIVSNLLEAKDCALLLIDFQAGLAFGVESISRQTVLSSAVALAKTAVAFDVPVVVSTSASKVYSGPLFPALQAVLPADPIDRAPQQRDWTRHETYEAARALVVENGGGYGMGLAYAREIIHPV